MTLHWAKTTFEEPCIFCPPFRGFYHLPILVIQTQQSCHIQSDEKYFRDSLQKIKESNVMTDVTFVLPDDSSIQCHEVVLMASSPFFEKMFKSGLKEGSERNVNLDFAAANTIRTLVDFFYSGLILVTEENVKDLVETNEFLCCEHLMNSLQVLVLKMMGAKLEWCPEKEIPHAVHDPCIVQFQNKVFVFWGIGINRPRMVTQEFDIAMDECRRKKKCLSMIQRTTNCLRKKAYQAVPQTFPGFTQFVFNVTQVEAEWAFKFSDL
ncbi:hypothetical protein CAPTEDRAFT_185452 [Capitella teleta]|uniref:BTB domain-containing protein n=1 Tax=Capitella teleta TaxID=283909 RepID=R7VCB6_CAPTE|nr:hypothetical protein CAPTEDRAFT_185452 [Capitella teleta]|eukprot:ELU16493.1 hypothetical protein CAPTEDRAFT_185452 [Capitella teleta]